MATTTRYPSIKRFGARYGTRVKYKVGKIEEERRASTECPYCAMHKARRISAGIWECKKCKNKFTGRAYTIGAAKPEEVVEEPVLEETKAEDDESSEETDEQTLETEPDAKTTEPANEVKA